MCRIVVYVRESTVEVLDDLETFPDTHLALLVHELVDIFCVNMVLFHMAHEFLSLRKH